MRQLNDISDYKARNVWAVHLLEYLLIAQIEGKSEVSSHGLFVCVCVCVLLFQRKTSARHVMVPRW